MISLQADPHPRGASVAPPAPPAPPAPSARPRTLRDVTTPDAGWNSRPPKLAKIYAVGGPTGGSGKTMIATNLAHLLATTTGGRVVLVDADLQFGEVNIALQLYGRLTIHDLLYDTDGRPHDDLELTLSLRESLTSTPHGFEVLPAPALPAQADEVGPEEITRVITNLRKQADFIVVDTPTGLRPTTNAALALADRLVCVTQVDVPGLYNLRSYLDSVTNLGHGPESRIVVLNKDLPGSGVQSRDAEELLGPVDGVVPFDIAVSQSLNHGAPVVADAPREGVSHDILGALTRLLPEGTTPLPRRRRRWWPFRGRRLHA